MTRLPRPSVDRELLADLQLAKKIVRLARLGDRQLVEFFFDLSGRHMLRVPLEALLDEHLGGGERR